jgi:hypothetical protein
MRDGNVFSLLYQCFPVQLPVHPALDNSLQSLSVLKPTEIHGH